MNKTNEINDKKIKIALYKSVADSIQAELSEIEAKEMLLINKPVYITSKDDDHAQLPKELMGLLRKQGGLRDSLRVVKERLKDLKAKD
tara:strand:+ start:216 stop:479 length:264 start_codon:yes stop_codon:yes gene_type:complete